jgi:hypothetical protein
MKFFDWLKKIIGGAMSEKAARPTKAEPYVYVTTRGTKFHYDILCPGIRNSKEIKMALSKARKAGYTACDKCCYSYLHD